MLTDLAADLRGVSQIVVVSDDVDALQSLTACLQRAGYPRLQVSPTASVIAALSSVNPDIVLLDASDTIDAVELVKGIRRELVGQVYVPIVVIETDPSPEARWRGLLAGADDVVTRPFDATEVFLRVQNLLRVRWLHCAVQSKSHALEVQLQERTRALFASRLELIDRLAAAIEIRDGYTGHHTRRVGGMAARIAEVYGEPPDSVERIRLAAPLHDIGKIGIPDSLLAKPGRLTPEEIRVMQRHTVIGWEFLSSGVSDVMVAAARIARSHHERWDGTGYPDGIAGEAIPLYARIVGVADVYDSLIFDRPYRRAMSREQAMAEMERGAGTHFDPELLTVFRTVIENGELD